MKKGFQIIIGMLGLLASAACTPGVRDFAQFSGYDAQGDRTGSFLPVSGTLTPY